MPLKVYVLISFDPTVCSLQMSCLNFLCAHVFSILMSKPRLAATVCCFGKVNVLKYELVTRLDCVFTEPKRYTLLSHLCFVDNSMGVSVWSIKKFSIINKWSMACWWATCSSMRIDQLEIIWRKSISGKADKPETCMCSGCCRKVSGSLVNGLEDNRPGSLEHRCPLWKWINVLHLDTMDIQKRL